MSVVRAVSHRSSLRYCTLSEPPAPRICYMLSNRYPNKRRLEVMKLFVSELEGFIAGNPDICTFEEWMLPGR